jgi:hypothetical protein
MRRHLGCQIHFVWLAKSVEKCNFSLSLTCAALKRGACLLYLLRDFQQLKVLYNTCVRRSDLDPFLHFVL